MYFSKILIPYLNICINKLDILIQDKTKTSFKEQHSKQLKIIKNYKHSLEELDETFYLTAEHIQKGLELTEHPEGGFYREFIRTDDLTIIFYLLPQKAVSSWHSLKDTEEKFKLILGEPLVIEKIGPDGRWKSTEEVKDKKNVIIEKSESGEFGDWFGAYTNGEYALVTCTCKGPFKFEKFKIAKKEDLDTFHEKNPDRMDIIDKLTPKVREKTNGIQSIIKFFFCCCNYIGVKKNEEQESLINNSLQSNR